MKKSTISFLTYFVFLFNSATYALDGKSSDFNFNAEFRFRDVWTQNPFGSAAESPQNTTKSRVKFQTQVRASEKFTANLTLLHSAAWGSKDLAISGSNATSGDSTVGVRNGTGNSDTPILVSEAYASWLMSESFLIKFGRVGLQLGDGSVVSTNDFQDFPYSFEGIFALYEWEFMRLTAWANKFAVYSSGFTRRTSNGLITEAASGATATDPSWLAYGLAVDWKLLPVWLKMFHFHLIRNQKDTSPAGATTPTTTLSNPLLGPGQDTYRYEVAIAGEYSNFDFRGDVAFVAGDLRGPVATSTAFANAVCSQAKCSTDTWMAHGVLGYTVPEWLTSRFFAVYHTDAGGQNDGSRFRTYDSYFYDIHNPHHGGLMDIVKWGNLTYAAAGYSMIPFDRFELSLIYHHFRRTVATPTAYSAMPGPYGVGLISFLNSNRSASANLGQEVDLTAIKKYDGGFEIEARVGVFFPGTYVKDNLPSGEAVSMVTQAFVQGKMQF